MNSLNKRLIRDYIYYNETLDDVIELSKEAEREFREALRQDSPEALEALAVPEGSQKPKKSEETQTINFEDKGFKKLFRKLAVKCHPDKIQNASERESAFLKKCYEDINIANDMYDWGMLLKVALDLEVEVEELTDDQLNNIKEAIENKKSKIAKYEESMAYKWYTLNDNSIKQKYLQQCADIFKSSLVPTKRPNN
jgi:hypothetical protein